MRYGTLAGSPCPRARSSLVVFAHHLPAAAVIGAVDVGGTGRCRIGCEIDAAKERFVSMLADLAVAPSGRCTSDFSSRRFTFTAGAHPMARVVALEHGTASKGGHNMSSNALTAADTACGHQDPAPRSVSSVAP